MAQTSFSLLQLLIGLILAVIISMASYRIGFLSGSGAIAAGVLGTIVFGLGGFSWALVLLGFFISSSGLSKFFNKRKQKVGEKFAKSSRRDVWQVIANGGLAGVFVLLHRFFPDQTWTWLAFSGTLAAVNADTWATEIGVLSRQKPVHLISGKKAEPGTSGAVSLLGISASTTAALLIAVLSALFFPKGLFPSGGGLLMTTIVAVTAAGVLGSLVDSFLGATVQAMFYCGYCDKETEKHPVHICGNSTTFLRGWKWMNNDCVNGICSLAGAVTMLLAYFIR